MFCPRLLGELDFGAKFAALLHDFPAKFVEDEEEEDDIWLSPSSTELYLLSSSRSSSLLLYCIMAGLLHSAPASKLK